MSLPRQWYFQPILNVHFVADTFFVIRFVHLIRREIFVALHVSTSVMCCWAHAICVRRLCIACGLLSVCFGNQASPTNLFSGFLACYWWLKRVQRNDGKLSPFLIVRFVLHKYFV